jgi:hypothetical protein
MTASSCLFQQIINKNVFPLLDGQKKQEFTKDTIRAVLLNYFRKSLLSMRPFYHRKKEKWKRISFRFLQREKGRTAYTTGGLSGISLLFQTIEFREVRQH